MLIKNKLLLLFFLFLGCGAYSSKVSVVPKPLETKTQKGIFHLTKDTRIIYDDHEFQFSAEYLGEVLSNAIGGKVEVKKSETVESGSINFRIDKELLEESYKLEVIEGRVDISASSGAGIFYGAQTLLQLFPPQILSDTGDNSQLKIEGIKIYDEPRFNWRGAMLDVSRHFFSVKEVKRYIDLISMYKINRLHLHLSDDQGWRIEIDSWPNLAKIGGSSEIGGGKGGYYTKSDYQEIIKYAKDRQITIIPEIDMPGHVNAILASYPELNPDGVAKEIYTGYGVGFSTLDLENELTYKFVEDVIRELADITPGDYMHIGGDEPDKTDKKQYKEFISWVNGIVNKYGKTMIGWEEVGRAKITKDTIIQKWKPNSVIKRDNIILSPAHKTYLDMKYDPMTSLGIVWAGMIDIKNSYNWDPLTVYNNLDEDSIIGIEAPLWSETLWDINDVEFMAFPRILSYSELAWSYPENIGWSNYSGRLKEQYLRLDELDVNYYKGN